MNEPSNPGRADDQSARPSPFERYQVARGARFGAIGGWRVPLSYESGIAGRRSARESAALLDLTPTGRIKVTGKYRVSLLQRISTNDLRPLEAGRFVPTLFVTPKGRIVDRALVLDRGESLFLITSPAGRERLTAWIKRYVLSDDCRMTDVSSETAAFAVLGPSSRELVKTIAGVGVGGLEKSRFLDLPAGGVDTSIVPYDLLPSAWMFVAERPGIADVYARALQSGAGGETACIGLEDAEVLRIEAGIPADGHELTEEWNPWEARLENSFSLTKGCYTGQEVIARLNTYEKVQRHLVGVKMGASAPPAPPQTLYGSGEKGEQREIGTLTSAAISDSLGETIGLGYVRQAFEPAGTEIAVGKDRLPASVCALPFV